MIALRSRKIMRILDNVIYNDKHVITDMYPWRYKVDPVSKHHDTKGYKG
jgi:hypothetical protein